MHDQRSSGGEIDVLDPAGYGSVFIHKSISIINDGVGVAGVLASRQADAISISIDATETLNAQQVRFGAYSGRFSKPPE